MAEKLKLFGFNNLTKTLSFNIYDICYAKTEREQNEYLAYIDEQYNSERLTKILCDVTDIVGANVLNISRQDYDPQGASVTVLISEERIDEENIDPSCRRDLAMYEKRNTVVGHLDKSHLTVHTYPEYHPDKSISSLGLILKCPLAVKSHHLKHWTILSPVLTRISSRLTIG